MGATKRFIDKEKLYREASLIFCATNAFLEKVAAETKKLCVRLIGQRGV